MNSFRLSVFFLFMFAGQLFSASVNLNKEVAEARAKKGDIVTCSPAGKVPGSFTVDEAAKKIKPGMVLRLLPGKYNPSELVLFDQDRIVVEGDGSGGYVDVPIILNGKDCVVRNIYLRSVEFESGVVSDSKIHSITVTAGTKHSSAIIENCAVNFMRFFANAQDINVRNCSVVVGVVVNGEGQVIQRPVYGTIKIAPYDIITFEKMERKGKVTIEKSVLFSESCLFDGRDASMKLVNLTLNDNIIWSSRSLYRLEKGKPEVKTIEGLKSYFELGKDMKNILEKPKLKKTPSDIWNWDMNPGIFIISSGPGSDKEYGCNMSETKGIPVPL